MCFINGNFCETVFDKTFIRSLRTFQGSVCGCVLAYVGLCLRTCVYDNTSSCNAVGGMLGTAEQHHLFRINDCQSSQSVIMNG